MPSTPWTCVDPCGPEDSSGAPTALTLPGEECSHRELSFVRISTKCCQSTGREQCLHQGLSCSSCSPITDTCWYCLRAVGDIGPLARYSVCHRVTHPNLGETYSSHSAQCLGVLLSTAPLAVQRDLGIRRKTSRTVTGERRGILEHGCRRRRHQTLGVFIYWQHHIKI